jgi:hypothetical protein
MSASVYLVTSFNIGGNGNVNVHVVTDDVNTANAVHTSVLEACKAEKARTNEPAYDILVECCDVSFNKPLLGSDARKLFQGQTLVTQKNDNNTDLTPPQSTTSGPSATCATPSSTSTRPTIA